MTLSSCGVLAQTTLDCSQSYLVSSQSGPSSTCPTSTNRHWWPIGDVTYCHGWAATDDTGKRHLNSAKNIRCTDANTFSYDQYAGNLDCTGSGVAKEFSRTCKQGFPPRLYDLAVNLECCGASGYATAGCTKGVPVVNSSATTNNLSYKNGIQCAEESSTVAKVSSGHVDHGTATSFTLTVAVMCAFFGTSFA